MPDTLSAALRRHIPAFVLTGLFSLVLNLLMLTGPVFMLQVYDRVLPSRSEPTLVALLLLVAGLFVAMAVLDAVRGRIGARVGAGLQADLDPRVFRAALEAPLPLAREAASAPADLDAVRRLAASPLAGAVFDLPFAPLFLAAIFILHPLMGWLAALGGGALIAVMLVNQALSRGPSRAAAREAANAARLCDEVRAEAETVRALGMTGAAAARWRESRNAALSAEIALCDRNGGFGAAARMLRQALQSAMLALGAWLVIRGEVTAGAMIASAILMGRALSPVEQLVGGWAGVVRAREGWASLGALLEGVPPARQRTALPRPKARLTVTDLAIVPPGASRPVLQRVSFVAAGGQAVGVVGDSASGKSSLARALAGLWRPSAGEIRLGGARLDQYREEALADHVGYLPQEVALFDGTVAENIARLGRHPDAGAVIAAARLAGAHETILALPDGYDTVIGAGSTPLSGGQKQRIGLARALFGDPALVVLDEPNASLDAAGSEAVNAAIRELKARGRIVIVVAHRPAAIRECDMILMIRNGQAAAFGPREDVLRTIAANHAQIVTPPRHQAASAAGAG